MFLGRSEACRFLLEQGAPVGVYDDSGTCALTLMIKKMPDVAKIALGQFETVDKALRKKYYYLNYLENDIWKRIATKKGNSLRQSYAKTPLEVCFLKKCLFQGKFFDYCMQNAIFCGIFYGIFHGIFHDRSYGIFYGIFFVIFYGILWYNLWYDIGHTLWHIL